MVGLPTNLKFLKRVIDEPVFNEGNYDTGYIEKEIKTLLKKEEKVDDFALISSVLARNHYHNKNVSLPNELINFRNVKGRTYKHKISISETSI